MSSQLLMVTYVKSAIGYNKRQKETVRSLGLHRIGDVAIHESSPAIEGMVRSVRHLVSVQAVAEADVVGQDSGRSARKGKGSS